MICKVQNSLGQSQFGRIRSRLVRYCLPMIFAVSMVTATPSPAAEPLPEPSAQEVAAFKAWIENFKVQALASGISQDTLDEAFDGIKINTRVLRADAYQPEFSKPIWAYLDGAASAYRIRKATEALAANKEILNQVYETYGVQSRFVVAIWGLETSFGAIMGDYNVIEALATLAFQGRRTKFGRTQLMAALVILESGDRTAKTMTGSWAGAMGHGQFIPTTYLSYAIDQDQDGKRDIWETHSDVFASISNYLDKSGWAPGQDWGREVILPEGFDYALADRKNRMALSEWRKKEVTFVGGDALPDMARTASIIVPAGHRGPAFLIFNNFRSILRYNNSTAYALAIGLIADQVAGGKGVTQPWPRDLRPLDRSHRKELQDHLNSKGFPVGAVDGIIGGKTRSAIRRFQSSNNLVADGFASEDLLDALRGEPKSVESQTPTQAGTEAAPVETTQESVRANPSSLDGVEPQEAPPISEPASSGPVSP
jgi:peptidoglycan lytic transglycosylase B